MKLRPIILSGLVLAAASVAGWARAAEEKIPRFQLEFFGYGTTLRESPLNKAVEFQSNRQSFYYGSYLTYLFQKSVLTSWKETVDGAWTGFETVFPLGARLKYNLSEHLMISLGAERLGAKATTSLSGTYVRTYTDASTDQLSFEHKPFELSVTAWAPTLGVHVYQPAKDGWSAEGGVLVGPLFGKIVSESKWIERGAARSFSEAAPRLDPTRTSQGTTRMEGSGIGVCLEIEGRLSFFLTGNLGIFGGVNIGFRTIPKLTGPGREERDGVTTEWDGEWAIRRVVYERAWTTLTAEYPSNDWTTDPSAVRKGDFRLDLSGIWLGGGLLLRF
jgi:hypothetical protein